MHIHQSSPFEKRWQVHQQRQLRTLRATGVVGADTDVFFLFVSFAAPSDGQATALPVSLNATADWEMSGEVGCTACPSRSDQATQMHKSKHRCNSGMLTTTFHAGL